MGTAHAGREAQDAGEPGHAETRRTRLIVGGLAVVAVAVAAVVAVAGRPSIKTYHVPSEAMLPTLAVGEKVDLNRDAYSSSSPAIGDIVLFHPPVGASTQTCGSTRRVPGQACDTATPTADHAVFIKRIVAGPGDTLALVRGRVIRNGRPTREPFVKGCDGSSACDFPKDITMPPGQYYMLGDNRGQSDDSRFWGPVRASWITGRVDTCSVLKLRCSAR